MTRRKGKTSAKPRGNKKKTRPTSGVDFLRHVKKRSHEKTNRRLNSRATKSVWASVAIDDIDEDEDFQPFSGKILRFFLALFLLPFCWVTSWTFLTSFSHATVKQGFWQSSQFWYFIVGAILMLGWFWSGLAKSFFLYLYVFGHELTHAAFVKCFGGRVLDIEWSSTGGHVTTNKTNWVIALSPYFVPFWTIIAVIIYVAASLPFEITHTGNLVFYGVIGATWTFHLAWTLWMIPRDQPDLQDNGTFLSLVLIYFGNLVVLITLLCFAAPSPVDSIRSFAYSWSGTAATWAQDTHRWVEKIIALSQGF